MRKSNDPTNDLIYSERLSSNKTEVLFLVLIVLSLFLLLWRLRAEGWGILAVVLLLFFILFLFYSVNYRTLIIQLTAQSLELKFGIFTWIVPLDNLDECRVDELPPLKRLGGAGIHFMLVRDRSARSIS
jgi:hypothetical protein